MTRKSSGVGYDLTFCGLTDYTGKEFLGMGSQEEYEKAEKLPPCGNCLRVMGLD